MKKLILLFINFIIIGLSVLSAQTAAQKQELEQIGRRSMNGLSSQDRQRVIQIMTDVYIANGIPRQQAAQLAELAADSMFSDNDAITPEQQRLIDGEIQRQADTDRQRQLALEREREEQDRREQATAQQRQQQELQRIAANNPANLVTPRGKAWVKQDNQVQGSGIALIISANNTYDYYQRVYGVWIPRETNEALVARGYTAIPGVTSVMAPPNIRISIYDYEYSLSGNTLDLTGYEYYAGRYTFKNMVRG